MKLRSFVSVLVAGLLMWFVVGCGGSPVPLARFKGAEAPVAAFLVPKQAPAVLSLLVNPNDLGPVQKLLSSGDPSNQLNLEEVKQSLLADTGLNYQQDVQPWLGEEITLALTDLDLDRDSANGLQRGYLLAAAVTDAPKAQEFLQQFWDKQALPNLQTEQYKGVTLTYTDPETYPKSLATALIAGKGSNKQPAIRFVLWANDPRVLRDAINNLQAPGLNLSSAIAYQKALENLTQDRIGLAFVNVPRLGQWFGNTSVTSAEEPSIYDTFALGLGLARQGLLAETALIPRPGIELSPGSPLLDKPVGALQYLPASSTIAASGSQLDRLWTQVKQGLTGYGDLSQLLAQSLQTLETTWGLSIPRDVFTWVDGDYALGFLPKVEGTQDWIFVAERSPAALEGIEKLDAIAKQKGLSVGPLTLGDRQVTSWARLAAAAPASKSKKSETPAPVALSAEIQGLHATVGNYEIFARTVEALEAALEAPDNPLPNQPALKTAIATLPQPNEGYLYLNWETLRQPLEQKFPVLKLVEVVGQSFFSRLDSFTISGYGQEPTLHRNQIFIRLI